MGLLARARLKVTRSASAALLLLFFSLGPDALAWDWNSPQARLAAVSIGTTSREHRDRVDADMIWLLAQSAPTAAPDQSSDAILAFFDESAPQTVEEDVAKAHGLEIVSRKSVEVLGMRMVRFRVPDQRSVTDVVAVLLADKRVTSAQANFLYRPLKQSPMAVSDIEERPHAKGGQEKRLLSASHKGEGNGRIQFKVPALRARSGVRSSYSSLRWPSADEPFVNVGMRD